MFAFGLCYDDAAGRKSGGTSGKKKTLPGMGGFWYDGEAAEAITRHADPLTMNEEGIFFTADGTAVASPIAV